MSEEGEFRVTVKGPGLNLDKGVPEALAGRIAVLLLTGHDRSRQGNSEQSSELGGDDAPPTSIGELFEKHRVRRIPDKIASIGYFLKKHQNVSEFGKSEIVDMFEQAAEPIPKNLTRDLKWTVRVNWIAPKPGAKDMFYVTAAGIKAVESNFAKEVQEKTRQQPSAKKKGKTR